jgi:rhamnose utilization protein RhaD (predicted bifunctional aldolase and dehydrogenase)
MNKESKIETKCSIIRFCSSVGRNPLFVQGAGGNVSWKEADTLWIKASGTWLINAQDEDIFLPVELKNLQNELSNKNFNVTPILKIESELRPSIETILHALMPHKVVVHLHAIEILAHLVRTSCFETMASLINDNINWELVDYYKPGASLAKAVSLALSNQPTLSTLFLKNHGVVIGGDNIDEVQDILMQLTKSLSTTPHYPQDSLPSKETFIEQFKLIEHTDIQQLALNKELFLLLKSNWALYPDHVVFLGAHPHTFISKDEFSERFENKDNNPAIIFVLEVGVFSNHTISRAKFEQLKCYFDIIIRQKVNTQLNNLSALQISELLNWDSEKYRMSLSNNSD